MCPMALSPLFSGAFTFGGGLLAGGLLVAVALGRTTHARTEAARTEATARSGPAGVPASPPPGAPPSPPPGAPASPPPGAPPGLRIGVLGPLTINGQPAALLPAQSQLLVALAVHGPLTGRRLCELLGGEPGRPRPPGSLRQLIVRTRRQLGLAPGGRQWIEHLGQGRYALHPDACVDLSEFDELAARGLRDRTAPPLRAALAMVRGEPFEACCYWWLDLAVAERARVRIAEAARVLCSLELAAGNPGGAARAARAGLGADPADEDLWRALMRAEHAAGNLAGVQEAWARCREAIGQVAAGGQPGPATAAVFRELTGRYHAPKARLERMGHAAGRGGHRPPGAEGPGPG